MNKREFIKKSSLAIGIGYVTQMMSCKMKTPSLSGSQNQRKEPFVLANLPYKYDALEPHIDMMTMITHHTKHHAGYVTKLNEAIKETKFEFSSIETICQSVTDSDHAAIRNNGGGHFNHSHFWESMSPQGKPIQNQKFLDTIQTNFGGFDQMKTEFMNSAKSLFGSGWTWLCLNTDKKLFICNTPNQDNPLMSNLVKKPGIPLLGIDIWEHAYYLKYQNKRVDYIESFFKVVDWNKVEERFLKNV